ncbi:MAG: hypothetical protein WBW55_04535 [Desulfobaccales bacterium]
MAENHKQAVERIHLCQASFPEDAALVERFGKEIFCRRVVSFFLIKLHPQTDKYYAWSFRAMKPVA